MDSKADHRGLSNEREPVTNLEERSKIQRIAASLVAEVADGVPTHKWIAVSGGEVWEFPAIGLEIFCGDSECFIAIRPYHYFVWWRVRTGFSIEGRAPSADAENVMAIIGRAMQRMA